MDSVKKAVNSNFFLFPFLIFLISGPEFATDMYIPSLPSIAHAFATTKSVAAMTITAFLLGQAVFQLFYGAFSDRYGRKPTILIGYGIFIVGCFLSWFSVDMAMFFVGRVLQGAGAAAGVSMTLAIVRDKYAGEMMAKMMSIVITVYFAVFACAPILGGYFEHYLGWRSNFIFLSIYTLVVFLAGLLFYKETHVRTEENKTITFSKVIKNYGSIVFHKIFLSNMLAASFAYCAMFAYAAITPFLFQKELHFSALQYGWLSVFTGVAFVVSSLCNAFLIERLGMKRMVVISIILLFIGSIVMLVLGYFGLFNWLVIMLPLTAFFFGLALLGVCCSAAAMTPFGHLAGSAGALWGSLQFFLTFASSFVFAHVAATTQIPFAWVLLILSALALLSVLWSWMGGKEEAAQSAS